MYVWHAPTRVEVAPRSREKFLVAAGAVMLGAIALATATASINVDLAGPPAALEAGIAWDADVRVKRAGLPVDDARPVVQISDGSGVTHIFQARPGTRPGSYRVKIVLPEGGTWSYAVVVGTRIYERGTVNARNPSLPEGI